MNILQHSEQMADVDLSITADWLVGWSNEHDRQMRSCREAGC